MLSGAGVDARGHGVALGVTGLAAVRPPAGTVAENLAEISPPDPDCNIIRNVSRPIHQTGGLTILHGSLAPDGAVIKTAGFDAPTFEATARVFDREQAAMDALTLCLRAERGEDGTRPFRLVPAPPLATSYGIDIYNRVFESEMSGEAVPPASTATAGALGVMGTPSIDDRVVNLYRGGWSIRQIAVVLGVGRPRARAALDATDLEVSPRGRGLARPTAQLARPEGVAEVLQTMYVEQGMTRRQVAEAMGVPEHCVRAWLKQSGLSPRSRGRANREDRRRLERTVLQRMYVDDGLPSREVGRRTGMQPQKVLAALHDQGLPVRVPNAAGEEEVVLLEALYGDPAVLAVLTGHDVPVVSSPGRLHERFPTPVPLTPGLLRELYLNCGLSMVQIEMVTGQPATTVTRHLKDAGVVSRSAGGLSPFSRRVRGRAGRRDS